VRVNERGMCKKNSQRGGARLSIQFTALFAYYGNKYTEDSKHLETGFSHLCLGIYVYSQFKFDL
jgi:hypothetical protein